MATSCVPLRSRSSHSLLTGTTAVADLVARAAKLGYGAIALTDRNGIYGAVPFFDAARALGVKPILGAEVTSEPPVGVEVAGGAEGTVGAGEGGPGRGRESVFLLARDREGLASLGTILTARHLDPNFDLVTAVASRSRGLHIIVDTVDLAMRLREAGAGGPGSLWLEATPRRGEAQLRAAAIADARRLGVRPVAGGRGSFLRAGDQVLHEVLVAVRENTMVGSVERGLLAGVEDYLRAPWEMESVLQTLPREMRDEALANSLAIAGSCDLTVRAAQPILPVAPHDAGRDQMEMLRARTLDGLRRRYEGGGRGTPSLRDAVIRMERELELVGRLGFAGYFLIVGEIAAFARRSGIPVVGRGSGASSIVAYALGVTSVDPIRHGLLFERFLNERRPDLPDLDIDLCWKRRDEVIEHVYDTYGRDRVAMISTHVTYGPRSAFRDVARAFGIPLDRVNLLSRKLPHDVPDEVAVVEAAGGESGLLVRTGPTASAYPHPVPRSGPRLSPLLTRLLAPEIPVASGPWPRILEATVALQGFPRHLGVHPGGIVIADRPLAEIVPLEEATKGVVVTQYEMRAAEAVGLVKIDLLGNRALTEVAETVRLVREAGGEAPDVNRIPENDVVTAKLLERGDTLGCFQIESPGMRNLLSQLGTQDLGDTIDAHSLIRPGPASSGVKEEFVRRTREKPVRRSVAGGSPLGRAWAHAGLAAHVGETARGAEDTTGRAAARIRERAATGDTAAERAADVVGRLGRSLGTRGRARSAFELPHPDLALILTGTHGVMLYEEDVMRVAAWLVGGDLGEGDEIRRAIAGSSEEELGEVGEFLIRRALARGLTVEVAEKVWNELKRFAAYTFCKAHAAGYGVLAYQTAYLKAHHPVEFTVALMNHHQGMYPRRAILSDARRHGVGVRPPCVNHSLAEWTLEDDEARVGLAEVKGLHERTLESIVEERTQGGGPYASLEDFLARVPLTRPEAEALILVGAFDFTGRTRPELVWELRTGRRERAREANVVSLWDLAADAAPDRHVPRLADFGPEDRLRHEWQFLELPLTMHPTETQAARDLARGAVRTVDLARHGSAGSGRGGTRPRTHADVSLVGVAIAHRTISTSRGESMMFLTLEDAAGVAECTLFPPAYRRYALAARSGGMLHVTGAIENQYGAVTVTVSRIEAFPLFPELPREEASSDHDLMAG